MKKLALTIAILALGMTGFAQGSMFQRQSNAQNGSTGNVIYTDNQVNRDGSLMTGFPGMPNHGEITDQPGQGSETPLGSGIVLLAGLGAAYLVGKRREEE